MRLAGWRVEGRGGSGNASRGWLVTHRERATPGFAKVFEASAIEQSMDDASGTPQVLAWAFETERQLLQRAGGCPHVVRLLHATPPALRRAGVLVLERAVGSAGSLPPLSWPEVQEAIDDVARGVCELHRCRIVHQDLKAANVLRVERDGRWHWVLGDLGRASSVDCWGPFAHHWVVGDRAWAPPELLFGAGSSGWWSRGLATDAWLLGALIYELVCGRPLTQHLWTLVPDNAKPVNPDAPTRESAAMWPSVRPVWAKAIRQAAGEVGEVARRRGATRAVATLLRRDFQCLCDSRWEQRPTGQRWLANLARRWSTP